MCWWCIWHGLPCFCFPTCNWEIIWTRPTAALSRAPPYFVSIWNSPKACVQMNESTKTPSLPCTSSAPLVTLSFTALVPAEWVRHLQSSSWSVWEGTALPVRPSLMLFFWELLKLEELPHLLSAGIWLGPSLLVTCLSSRCLVFLCVPVIPTLGPKNVQA